VIFQFALSILLLIVTIVVDSQIRYVQARDIGFDKDHILALPASPDVLRRYEAFRSELRRHPAVSAVCLSGYVPGRPMVGEEYGLADGDSEKRVGLTLMAGSEGLGDVLELRLVQGRLFRENMASDASAAVINETAARRLSEAFHWDGPLGKTNSNGRDPLVIIGVVRDFNFQSLHREIDPLAIVRLPPREGPFIAVRVRRGAYLPALALLDKTWRAFAPGQPFEPAGFGREIEGLYGDERRTRRLLGLFTILAIGLGCLGLYGIAVFAAERRTKEIGIRRVLGASAGRLIVMLVKQSAGWVLAANLIAWPAAFFFVSRWLQEFAYRARIRPAAFVISGGVVLLLSCATVGAQALRASSTDPVDSLRSE
jgi:putative ABC transport system permease protein